ncbi:glycosyltransferase [Pseudarthrobacter sp. ATCC 49987]|uniref:glycosyltransferase n=1 Tax=Pseudarthrobacter sp. ATCC 49987 TaxID=2698204 RepID=UPI001368DF75|nr:glycosyltransferase [Pseudarthrobacter sp. ATCC 49987]
MKILVYPHDLGIGGSQLNAIELAAAVQRLGHEVIVFGRPGPLNRRIEESGLEFVPSPEPHHRPTPSVVKALVRLARERKIDVIHGYEWPPALEGLIASRRSPGTAAVATVMSMAVAPFIPKSMPILVGTQEIVTAEQEFGRTFAALLEPPVDLDANNPSLDVAEQEFRGKWDLDPAAYTVVLVTRLAKELKLEGILAAIDCVGMLSQELPIQLVIAGDGPARRLVENHAQAVNAARGRPVIVLTGELGDPRAAYAVADVALGMGGSALRAMAFAKPLIVQGEKGFWELLTPDSLPLFLEQGWYGVGPGTEDGAERLAHLLRGLLPDESCRRTLGGFGLSTVQERFSLTRGALVLENFYEQAIEAAGEVSIVQEVGALARFVEYELARRLRGVLGSPPADDFNSRPVAGRRQAGPAVEARTAGRATP